MNKKIAFFQISLGVLCVEYFDEKVTSLHVINTDVTLTSTSTLTDIVTTQVEEYLQGQIKDFTFPIFFQGTPLQKAVWEEILKIPYGETRTYEDVARNISRPKAYRVVGHACRKNPLWFVIPCHRVIGKNGKLTGYAGGLTLKEQLLKLEKQNKN